MLAQNFKTPSALEIADVEFEALVMVLRMLERGELTYGEHPFSAKQRQPNEFNMASTLQEGCGTIACICGWAHIVSNRVAFADFLLAAGDQQALQVLERMPTSLRKLFRFGAACGSLYSIRPSHAAIALRSYLTNGEPRWSEALAD